MANLKAHEKIIFEKLFDRGGYVLNFTDRTFSEFFREHRINIDQEKYRVYGNSKMKRLRAFWEIEADELVGQVISALLEYACAIEEVGQADREAALKIISRLTGSVSVAPNGGPLTENEFLQKEFSDINWAKLNIDIQIQPILEQRVAEISMTLSCGAALSTVFLCGSTLEGLLQDAASKQPQKFNEASSAPKTKEGVVRPFHDWSLDALINVSHEVGLLSLDIKKHGHALKDFRNYIHPRQQAIQRFHPDKHTARISWQVLQAAIANLSGARKH